jgi:HEAT repeat protein
MPVRRAKPEPPPEFRAEAIEKLDQAALLKVLAEPGAEPVNVFRKGLACKRLAVVGTKEAVPAIAALLGDERISDYAREALECMPDPACDDALRAALPKLKGLTLIGAINSIRRRRDAKALDPLTKLIYGSDLGVASAAAEAVGEISGPVAAKTLQRALTATKGPVRASAATGALLCADHLLATDRPAAMALLDTLSRPDIPSNVRVAALHMQFAAEVSLKRPRTAPASK